MVPAITVPKHDPRLDTLRDTQDISPWSCSGKADCTTLTDGLSMTPRPTPMRNSPGAKYQAPGWPLTMATSSRIPATSHVASVIGDGSRRNELTR